MAIIKQQPVKKREVIKQGKAWMRWIMVPFAFFSVLHFFSNPLSLKGYVAFLITVGLFYLLKRARRLEYDEKNLYIIRDKKEKVVPFTSIISIKKSRTKVNGERFWKLKYEDTLLKKKQNNSFF